MDISEKWRLYKDKVDYKKLRIPAYVMLCLEHCFIWLRDLVTKKSGAEVFGELQNVVLEEENGEDKMVREIN